MSVWVADALVLLGLVVLTVGLVGLMRLPTVMMRVHASGKAAAMGVVPLALAAAVAEPGESAGPAVLVVAFVVLTSPVASHLIARADHRQGPEEDEEEEPPDAERSSGSRMSGP